MISVRNLQLPSNGNNILWLFIICVGILSSCGKTQNSTRRSTKSRTKNVRITTPKKTRKQINNPSTTEKERETSTTTIEKVPVEDTSTGIFKENTYDLTYLLPLNSNTLTGVTFKNKKFVQYFAGIEIAKEVLEREGIALNINVVDSEKNVNSTNLEQYVNDDTDAIVGLYSSSDLKEAATYARRKKIPLISPWKASSKIATKNPYYIQLRPNLDEYYRTIVEDVTKHYNPEHIFILRRESDKDKKMAKYIQYYGKTILGTDSKPFTELEVHEDSLAYGETAFGNAFSPTDTNVIIIPHFSFAKDEKFIYGCTRKLTVEKGPADIVVYGMEILLDSDKITYDHYSSLNVRVARTKFVDQGDSDVNRFKRKFLQVYGCLPDDDAYEGYDNLMYIGRALHKYGKNFQHYLSDDTGYYLQAAYDVQPTYEKKGSDDFKNINYFENKHVDIIKFENGRFRREIKD